MFLGISIFILTSQCYSQVTNNWRANLPKPEIQRICDTKTCALWVVKSWIWKRMWWRTEESASTTKCGQQGTWTDISRGYEQLSGLFSSFWTFLSAEFLPHSRMCMLSFLKLYPTIMFISKCCSYDFLKNLPAPPPFFFLFQTPFSFAFKILQASLVL